MIKLHQFPAAFGVPNASIFCMKVETYLRMAGLEYETVTVLDPSKTPKGKAPFLEDKGNIIADSHFIVEYLQKEYGDPLGEGLDDATRARHNVLRHMIEEHLYFALVHECWIVPENAEIMKDTFFAPVPKLIRNLVFAKAQKNLSKALYRQGMGRHSRDDIVTLAKDDINDMALWLGDSLFYGGEIPREIDCVTYAAATNLLKVPGTSPVFDHARTHDNLKTYVARMDQRVFPELIG